MNAGLVPADYLLGALGKGPHTRLALVGVLMGRGYGYDDAAAETGQAILALVKAGRIESFNGADVWRLTAKFAQTEKIKKPPTDRQDCHETTGKPETFNEPIGFSKDGSGE